MNPIIKSAIGIIGGLAVGGAYSFFARCTTGYCPMNSSPEVPVLVGGAIGWFIAASSK